MKLLDIKFDLTDLEEIEHDLQYLDAQTLSELRRSAVNEMSLQVRKKSIDDTVRQLNLTRDYVEQRVERFGAMGNQAVARVKSQVRGATLQGFGGGPTQLFKPVNWTNQRIRDMGLEFGTKRGYSRVEGRVIGDWTERMGDPSRGIPANFKQDGVAVGVKRGLNAKRIATAFTMPLRRGATGGGNGMGVFQRQDNGRIKHLYGPSVYQTFRSYVQENEANIADGLRDEFLTGFDRAIRGIAK